MAPAARAPHHRGGRRNRAAHPRARRSLPPVDRRRAGHSVARTAACQACTGRKHPPTTTPSTDCADTPTGSCSSTSTSSSSRYTSTASRNSSGLPAIWTACGFPGSSSVPRDTPTAARNRCVLAGQGLRSREPRREPQFRFKPPDRGARRRDAADVRRWRRRIDQRRPFLGPGPSILRPISGQESLSSQRHKVTIAATTTSATRS